MKAQLEMSTRDWAETFNGNERSHPSINGTDRPFQKHSKNRPRTLRSKERCTHHVRLPAVTNESPTPLPTPVGFCEVSSQRRKPNRHAVFQVTWLNVKVLDREYRASVWISPFNISGHHTGGPSPMYNEPRRLGSCHSSVWLFWGQVLEQPVWNVVNVIAMCGLVASQMIKHSQTHLQMFKNLASGGLPKRLVRRKSQFSPRHCFWTVLFPSGSRFCLVPSSENCFFLISASQIRHRDKQFCVCSA